VEIDSFFDWVEKSRAQSLMYLAFFMVAVASFFGGTAAVEAGAWPLLSTGMFVLAVIGTASLRFFPEKTLDRSFLDPYVMSWAFVIGGSFVVPTVLWFAGRGRSTASLTSEEQGRTLLASIAIGVIVMIVFRRFDSERYESVGWGSALWSPSKVWVDFVVVPVASAMVAWLMLPQLVLRLLGEPERAGTGGDTFIASLFLLVVLAMVVIDAINPPDPRRQHCRWNWKTFSRDYASVS